MCVKMFGFVYIYTVWESKKGLSANEIRNDADYLELRVCRVKCNNNKFYLLYD